MHKQQLKETVVNVLRDLSGIEDIDMEQTLADDLGLNSLHMVTMLLELESALNIVLDESDLNPYDLEKVADLYRLASRYVEADEAEENVDRRKEA